MKALLVTSDDMGMTLSVNRGIERAICEGLVGATNLMVPTPWFQDAVRRVKQHNLPAGIHLTLTSEWDRYRWGPLTQSEHLRAEDGRFHRSYEAVPEELTRGEIRREFDAQLAALRAAGVEPTHAETHMIGAQSASPTERKVKAVVREFCSDEGLIYTYDTDESGALLHFDSETMFTPETVDEFKRRLAALGDGVHHVISHCAEDGPDLAAMCSRSEPGYPWAHTYRIKDYEALMSEQLRMFVESRAFEVLDMRSFLALRAGSSNRSAGR